MIVYTLFMILSFLATTDCQRLGQQQGQGHSQGQDQICLIVPPEVDACYRQFQNTHLSSTAAQVYCLQRLLWNYTPDSNITAQDLVRIDRVINKILTASGVANGTRFGDRYPLHPPSGFRLRSEYRTLSERQRKRFHIAMNRLYEDGVIGLFARIHAVGFGPQHNGASFLAWHRVLLTVFEEFLREIDPSVSLPYLDTTIDDAMDNPVNSVLWSEKYLGNGAGPVRIGPFKGWVTGQGFLERDYGRQSRLFRKADLRNVLTRCRLEEISTPTASSSYNLETFHNGFHSWVGGDMAAGRTTGYDPAFYLHHAYVDYIWEVFRRRQKRRCRVDPTRDYPNVRSGSHANNSPMVGLRPFINRDGLADYWTKNFYGYKPTPACPSCCRRCKHQAPIFCDRSRRICTGRSRRNIPRNVTQSLPLPMTLTAAVRNELMDEFENEVMDGPVFSLNRGGNFHGPQNDGRTLESAIFDAVNFERRNKDNNNRHVIPESMRGPDDRGSGSSRIADDTFRSSTRTTGVI